MSTIPIYNIEGKEVDKLELKKEIFDGQINTAVLHQALTMYSANQRQGNAAVKDRSKVSGGGIKPWRQKGTGRARVGSIRSPLWRHGGVTFGPQPREYRFSIPGKMRQVALRSSINSKLNDKDLILVEDVVSEITKTKDFKKILNALKVTEKALVVSPANKISLLTAARNIPFCKISTPQEVSVDDILRAKKVIITKNAMKDLIGRLK